MSSQRDPAHEIPFYVAAPSSTIDPKTICGEDIPIEERPADEVFEVHGEPICAPGTQLAHFFCCFSAASAFFAASAIGSFSAPIAGE